jgi:protein-S-isoprenylcysteine O-methyltransferase Ste14
MSDTMKATEFEYRHQTLLHLLVVGAAFLAYVFQPDDIVWAFVKHHTIYRALLERLVFGTGTLMILGSATFQTWANTYRLPQTNRSMRELSGDESYRRVQHAFYFGRLLFALGLGLLAPISGTAILLLGEIILVVRLTNRENLWNESRRPYRRDGSSPPLRFGFPRSGANWKSALRSEISKWGLAVTMIVFTVTLRDRVAEILAAASFLLWAALNWPELIRDRRNA